MWHNPIFIKTENPHAHIASRTIHIKLLVTGQPLEVKMKLKRKIYRGGERKEKYSKQTINVHHVVEPTESDGFSMLNKNIMSFQIL